MKKAADALMERLQEQYDVFAPRLFPGTGCYSDTDVVRYGQISSLSEIVWDKKSEYSFKETLLPISDTVFYFTEDEVKVPDAPRKRRLIFLRSCELCALKRLDGIYLKNGFADSYYERIREQADFVWMCCEESFASCFCASMGTNRPERYEAFARFTDGKLYLEAEKGLLKELLEECGQDGFGEEASLNAVYPEENQERLRSRNPCRRIWHPTSYGRNMRDGVSAAAAAILSVPPVPVLPCRIFSIKIIQRPGNAGAYGLPAR